MQSIVSFNIAKNLCSFCQVLASTNLIHSMYSQQLEMYLATGEHQNSQEGVAEK